MILRASIFKTKKLLKKTLERFKFFFSKEYHRLPKTSPFSDHSCHHSENLSTQFKDHSDFIKDDSKRQIQNKPIRTPPLKEQKQLLPHHSLTAVRHESPSKYNRKCTTMETRKRNISEKIMKEERSWLVAEKLKALEKMSDVDHIADIEEALYYYSRLTCPAYLDIVDRFFMEIRSDFVSSSPSSHSSIKPRSSKICVTNSSEIPVNRSLS